jgi:hypothetical protein
LKKELENNNPQIPKNEKQVDKTNEKKKDEKDAPVTGIGTFLVVRECGTICASS